MSATRVDLSEKTIKKIKSIDASKKELAHENFVKMLLIHRYTKSESEKEAILNDPLFRQVLLTIIPNFFSWNLERQQMALEPALADKLVKASIMKADLDSVKSIFKNMPIQQALVQEWRKLYYTLEEINDLCTAIEARRKKLNLAEVNDDDFSDEERLKRTDSSNSEITPQESPQSVPHPQSVPIPAAEREAAAARLKAQEDAREEFLSKTTALYSDAEYMREHGHHLQKLVDVIKNPHADQKTKDDAFSAFVTASQPFMDLSRVTTEQNVKAQRRYNLITGIITATAFLIGAVLTGIAITFLSGGTLTIPYFAALTLGGLASGALSFGIFRCCKPADKEVPEVVTKVGAVITAAKTIINPR